uniref:Uncharacterized protein n=1 Tax=Ascaris lumbricoides TaxID=6252 RepID=A0A0M3HJW1_ASCLU
MCDLFLSKWTILSMSTDLRPKPRNRNFVSVSSRPSVIHSLYMC